jgi:hypothetical protein
VDTLDRRPDRAQLLQECGRDEVARMQDQLGIAKQAQTVVRQAARTARQVGVRDDGDARQI